ncbi:L,D-transpeptidase family protein [Erythrobacter sp. GH1-10]|uniref:L,D-transpeptidase family protein n=1 Tax=Erythrobacter sp. GH1-10 TaxID=3349334 RepID=UPI0038779519
MIRQLLVLLVLLAWPTTVWAQSAIPTWSTTDIAALLRWVDAAPEDALPKPSAAELEAAIADGEAGAIDSAANDLALRLARMHLLGSAGRTARAGWRIVDTDADIDLEPMLANALQSGALDTFFALLRPTHPEYSRLRAAYGADEIDQESREAIARNMERWRWMPRSLGEDYVLVNAAEFRARLWRDGELAGTWPVIVGKTSTPTPVFDTKIEGVIFNPWWNIPASIVRESVGALVRRNPAAARARGYVWSDGVYRQKPGPNNALGQMKLVMPNPYSVYMHDTPGKHRFAEEVRTFSHGCIRTGDAIGYAATLLEGVKTREEIDAIVASLKTTRVDLEKPIPVYVAYFTAVGDGEGGVKVLTDVYNRDRRVRLVRLETECSGQA